MAMAPKQLITGPSLTTSPYGLFTVVTPTTPADPHWQNGVEWETLPCRNLSGIGDPECDPDGGPTQAVGLPKNFKNAGPDLDEATAFTVYASYQCSPVGHTIAEAQDMATRELQLGEQSYVEWELWSGHLGSTPTLPSSAEAIADGPLDPLVALAALEAWFHGHFGTMNGMLGYVHMGLGAATILAKKAALRYQGNAVYTPAGSRVIIGTGYGSGSLAEDGTYTDRIYITPPPFIYRSEIFTSSDRPGDLLDRRTNDLYAVAERTYLVGWNSCPVSAYVDLQYPDPGEGVPLPTVYPFTMELGSGQGTVGDDFEITGTGTPGRTVTLHSERPSGGMSSGTSHVGDDATWSHSLPLAEEGIYHVTAESGVRTLTGDVEASPA